jgi:hypothetical protein
MSVLERRFMCPGSMAAEEGRPNTTSVYAKRGTNLHEVAAVCLRQNLNPLEVISEDPEGAELVLAYIIEVQSAYDRLGGDLLVEHPFEIASLSDLYWGTADAVIISPPVLYVADFKTGRGHAVPVRRPDGRVNLQLGGYGLGALHGLPAGLAHEITKIELVVVQPALGPPQRTVMTTAEVQDLAADLIEIAERALDPDAVRIAGDHCRFCRAAGDCPAFRARAVAAIGLEFEMEVENAVTILPDPAKISRERLGGILEGAEIIDEWLTAVRAHAKALADKGEEIPGWKLVDKRGRRVWASELSAEHLMSVMLGNAAYATKLHSPTQIEKILKAKKMKKPVEWNTLVTMSDPGTALVPASDPRAAVAPRIEFEQVKQEEQ